MMDVARLAGVSHQTVSRVLNNHPKVRPDTRERVETAIQILGYRPNRTARALATRRTQTIGVIAGNATYFGPASTLVGVEGAAREAGYSISTAGVRVDDRTTVEGSVHRLLGERVDGIVVVAPQPVTREVLDLLPAAMPAVAVECARLSRCAVVGVDQQGGAQRATSHLLGLGHRTVWHVKGARGWNETQGRARGWKRALLDAGAPVPDVMAGDWSPRSGYEAGVALASQSGLTAVFVANDQMALGLLRAFSERGVRVPEDVSVVGFDDIPEAEYFSPPLTTVRQDFGEIGRSSMRLLLEQMRSRGADDGPAKQTLIPAELVIRGSTAPPNGARSARC
jgi:DNA-binding LacI/PurR family transcriptional regulator